MAWTTFEAIFWLLFHYFISFQNMIFKLSILPFLNSLHYLKLSESELISVKDGGYISLWDLSKDSWYETQSNMLSLLQHVDKHCVKKA